MNQSMFEDFTKLDIWDTTTEPIWLISAILIFIAMWKLYRFYGKTLWIIPAIGSIFYIFGALIDLSDEYIIIPNFIDTVMEDLSKLIGYSLFAFGLIIIAYSLIKMSNTDYLTGINNRRCFFNILNKEIERAKRDKTLFSIVFVDVDKFKQINDLFGHLAGDNILKKLALKMKENIRTIDTFYRFGGDEFIVLMPNTDNQSAINVMIRLDKSISEIKLSDGNSLKVSYGISQYPDDGSNIDILLSTASKRMYEKKSK